MTGSLPTFHPDEPFFPPGAPHRRPVTDVALRGWFGQHLFAMHEPRLHSPSETSGVEVMRVGRRT